MPKSVPPHVVPDPVTPSRACNSKDSATSSRSPSPLSPWLYRPRQISEGTGLCLSMVYQVIAKGELGSVKIGRSVRVPAAALEAWLRRLEDEALDREPETVEL